MKRKTLSLLILAFFTLSLQAHPSVEAARKWIPFSYQCLELAQELKSEFQLWNPLLEVALVEGAEEIQLPELSALFWLEKYQSDRLVLEISHQPYLSLDERMQLEALMKQWLQLSEELAEKQKAVAKEVYAQMRYWETICMEVETFLKPRLEAAGHLLLANSGDGQHLQSMRQELGLAYQLLGLFSKGNPESLMEARELHRQLQGSLEASRQSVPPAMALFPVKQAFYAGLLHEFVPQVQQLIHYLETDDYAQFNQEWSQAYRNLQSSYTYAQQQFRFWIELREEAEIAKLFGQ
jgi:hypothetical protein